MEVTLTDPAMCAVSCVNFDVVITEGGANCTFSFTLPSDLPPEEGASVGFVSVEGFVRPIRKHRKSLFEGPLARREPFRTKGTGDD